MKSSNELELGILPTFRLFTGMQLFLTALGLTVQWVAPQQSQLITMSPLNLLGPGLLLVYLSIPELQRRLKFSYVPIGVLWAALGLVLDPYLAGNASSEVSARWIWRQILFLFGPLVVVSWKYSIRHVIAYSALVTSLNLILFARTSSFQELITDSLLAVFLIQLMLYILVGNMVVKFMKIQRGQWQQLRDANERLAQHASTVEQLAISQERNRLARELHDVLAHTLSGVAVQLEGVRVLLHRDPEQASAMLDHSLQAIREGLSETRRALKELRAKPLEDLGLGLAVQTLAESYMGHSNLQIDLDIDHDLGDYAVDVQQCAYRVAQEALANAVKHSQAQSVYVKLNRSRTQLQLVVRDDGCGFDPGSSENEHHYGLLGMRERAEMIGGKLSVESRVGRGTQVSFSYGGDQ